MGAILTVVGAAILIFNSVAVWRFSGTTYSLEGKMIMLAATGSFFPLLILGASLFGIGLFASWFWSGNH
jgi:phosphoglycerol transferase MdoB-like AlkP superfamily enzyme